MGTFTIRVYGILINEQKEVLVADEMIRGARFTKFPGGGLEYGEGTRDCLVREFMEELSLKVRVLDHLYTTDYFQASAFAPNQQILSIYYYVEALEPIKARLGKVPFELIEEGSSSESFRFIPISQFSAEEVTLPIDKIVAE